MGNLVGRVIGGVAAGAFAIGGAVAVSQLDAQTDEINKQVDQMNVLGEKVGKEYRCYAVEKKCEVINGTAAEYEKLNSENDELLESYNKLVDKYNNECAATGVSKGDEQKCLDLNNNAAKMVDDLLEQLEALDKFIADQK